MLWSFVQSELQSGLSSMMANVPFAPACRLFEIQSNDDQTYCTSVFDCPQQLDEGTMFEGQ